MFLLVSVRHVGAHPDELQHGVSIQSSINLGKTFPRISRIRIIPSTQILARVFVYLPPFISQILDAWHWKPAISIISIHSTGSVPFNRQFGRSFYISEKVTVVRWNQNFSNQKNPEVENFKAQKILRSSLSLEIRSTPPPPSRELKLQKVLKSISYSAGYCELEE